MPIDEFLKAGLSLSLSLSETVLIDEFLKAADKEKEAAAAESQVSLSLSLSLCVCVCSEGGSKSRKPGLSLCGLCVYGLCVCGHVSLACSYLCSVSHFRVSICVQCFHCAQSLTHCNHQCNVSHACPQLSCVHPGVHHRLSNACPGVAQADERVLLAD